MLYPGMNVGGGVDVLSIINASPPNTRSSLPCTLSISLCSWVTFEKSVAVVAARRLDREVHDSIEDMHEKGMR